MRPYEEVAIEIEQHVWSIVSNIHNFTHIARQYPTIAKLHRQELTEAREQLNDILARLERNWDQVAAE